MSAIVTGTLISFLPGFEWYYNACKACNNKVTTAYVITDPVDGVDGSKMVEQKKIIQCPSASCNKKVIVIVSRYKIPLRLQDNTSVVSLIVLDREAKKMLKKRQRFA
ncbi:putative nucleic acid-binding protein [Helianthus annuus]|nr:putative nucleic acid-binding protein [Helianthus annuus]